MLIRAAQACYDALLADGWHRKPQHDIGIRAEAVKGEHQERPAVRAGGCVEQVSCFQIYVYETQASPS